MIPKLGVRSVSGIAYAAVLLFTLLFFWPAWVPVLTIIGVLAYLELAGLIRRFLSGPPRYLALILGGLYIGVGLGALAALQFAYAGEAGSLLGVSFGRWAVLALFVTWAADVGAYLVGSLVGRRRLAPRISPGKTIEGTIGGFVAAAVTSIAVGAMYSMAPAALALIAVASGPAGLAGDLAESAVKRAAGVKDSGSLLPGHGGALDRIDSLLVVAPVVFVAFLIAEGLG